MPFSGRVSPAEPPFASKPGMLAKIRSIFALDKLPGQSPPVASEMYPRPSHVRALRIPAHGAVTGVAVETGVVAEPSYESPWLFELPPIEEQQRTKLSLAEWVEDAIFMVSCQCAELGDPPYQTLAPMRVSARRSVTALLAEQKPVRLVILLPSHLRHLPSLLGPAMSDIQTVARRSGLVAGDRKIGDTCVRFTEQDHPSIGLEMLENEDGSDSTEPSGPGGSHRA
jgi:hypothetical protein